MEGVKVSYKDGKVVAEIEVKAVLAPELEKMIAKVESGEIDIVKGTDLDKTAALIVLNNLKAHL